MTYKFLVSLFLYLTFFQSIGLAQFIYNPSFEGSQGQSISPDGWLPCNEYSTPDTQPGTWMVDQSASEGLTYISLVTRGNNGGHNDGYTEATSTNLYPYMTPNTCYNLSLELAYSGTFDDYLPERFGTWKPIKLNIWASTGQCEKSKLIWKSPIISQENWQTFSFNFTVERPSNSLILEAIFAETEIHNGNILIDNVRLLNKKIEVTTSLICPTKPAIAMVDYPNANIIWSTGATGNTTEINEAGLYSVSVNSENCAITDTFSIHTAAPLKVDLGYDVVKCLRDSIVLTATNPFAGYQWNNGSNASSIQVKQTGNYTVKVSNGCEVVEDDINITFDEQCCVIGAPNLFTPNDDKINDNFEFTSGSAIGKFDLKIYNRWGSLVYQSKSIKQQWDGLTTTGEPAAEGIYYWNVDIFCIQDQQIIENSYKGIISILR